MTHATAETGFFPRIVQSPNPKAVPQSRNRVKDYLTDHEMQQLLKAASQGRHGIRDYAMVLLAYHHGLRVSELTDMPWMAVNVQARELYVKRLKGSASNTHPLLEDDVKALNRWLKVRDKMPGASSARLFLTERGEGFTRFGFNYLMKAIGERAGFTFAVYPHLLRHSCAQHLADRGDNAFTISSYLGHMNIQNSLFYVNRSAAQFKKVW